MNRQVKSILIFVKSIDGGTGTLTESLSRLGQYGPFKTNVVVLEKPAFRKSKIKATFLHEKNYYPDYYTFRMQHIKSFLKEILWYKKKVEELSPSSILSLDVHCNLISTVSKILFFKRKKLILVTNINISETISLKSSWFLQKTIIFLIKILYSKSDTFIFPSTHMARDMKKQYGIKQKTQVIHYGLKKQKAIQNHRSREFSIVSVGRLSEQKDFTSLIHAFARVNKEFGGWSLCIVGDGPMKKELDKLIRTKKMVRHIRIVGWKDSISEFIATCSIFVLSSRREGFPYVLLHALAAGVPIISTNALYGPSEILDGGVYGKLVPVGDVPALAASMKLLMLSKKEREKYSKLSQKRASVYSEESMLNSFAKILLRFD